MISEKEMGKIWKKYICKKVYRIIPFDQKEKILEKGMDPSKDPYEKEKSLILKIYDLVKRLEKKEIVYSTVWGKKGNRRKVSGSEIIDINTKSIRGNYLDFVYNKKQLKIFKKAWKGGCLVTYTKIFCDFLFEHREKITKAELNLVKKLNKWASGKQKEKKYAIISIRGNEGIFEKAKFYCFHPKGSKDYWESPFGSIKNFSKVIKNNGLEKYLPYLNKEKLFYLRVGEKISPKIIKLEKRKW